MNELGEPWVEHSVNVSLYLGDPKDPLDEKNWLPLGNDSPLTIGTNKLRARLLRDDRVLVTI